MRSALRFGVVQGFLLRPLPYPDADELVTIYAANPARDISGSNISRPDYEEWRARNRTFEQIGIWTWSTLTLTGAGEPERVDATHVSPNLFPLLGLRPILGRGFAVNCT